ncbi:SNF2 family N-terminal domain-containing protein [Amylostereum chailletii]|nr:SNF2 family N-terminal domain-containing protein [Amylostereum chailletii]
MDDLPAHIAPGIAKLTASLRLVIPSPVDWDEASERLPFRASVHITLSFFTPRIFEPISPDLKRAAVVAQEARDHLLQLAFPTPNLSPSLEPSFHGRIDIPFFYAAVHGAPAPDSQMSQEAAQPDELVPTLLPFQRRSVIWMLSREGKSISQHGKITDSVKDSMSLPPLWERVTVQRSSGEQINWYYHRLTGTLTPEFPEDKSHPGGILAEEPGLGKTLECISLILLNPGIERNPSTSRWDVAARVDVKQVKTSLIVTPSSLAQQWIDELAAHAPVLKVLVYDGWSKLPAFVRTTSNTPPTKLTGKAKTGNNAVAEESETDWCSYVNRFDVCITTYNVLQQDLNVARPPPRRPRRKTADYSRTERPRSPLVMCEFFRVIMDEVQMVGGGKTSEMVSLIPRSSSFAVSGTPARAHVADLSHVLKFLRVDPQIVAPRSWSRLLEPNMASNFVALFQHYTVRTLKASVKDELTIPQQTRYLVPIELGRVERHVYDQALEKSLQELGLDARGVAATENWEIDTALLRSCLRRLRQICTHPQVGQLKVGEKFAHKPGRLKTMGEVLDGMSDQNWRNLMEDRRTKINELARCAQLTQHAKHIQARHHKSAEILLQAEKEANQLIEDIKTELAHHNEKGEALKREVVALGAARKQHSTADNLKAKGKGRAASPSTDSEDNDSEDGDIPDTPAGKEHKHKKHGMQSRLREADLSLHRVKFLQGDVYHVLGEGKAVEEARAYAAAEELRRQLLKLSEEAATFAMAQLAKEAIKNTSKTFICLEDMLIKLPYCPQGGARSAEKMEEADIIIEEGINAQSSLLWAWRPRIYELLTQSLSAGEGDADGQEYSRSLETQGEAEAYLKAYSALLADRREIMIAERTMLAAHEDQEKKKRKTMAAAKAAEAYDDDVEIPEEDVELQPEHEVLYKELTLARREIMSRVEGSAIKSVLVDLTAVVAKIPGDDNPEKVVAKEGIAMLRQLMTEQATINDKIEMDLKQFRRAFNERIQYFRQLQEISDSVVEVEWDGSAASAIEESRTLQGELDGKINTGRARQRYLDNLAQSHEQGQDEDEDGCILCKCEFNRGYITQCAHVFCEDCMKSWLNRHSKACPVCRVPINVDHLQRFTVQAKDKEGTKPALVPPKYNHDTVPKSRRQIEYNVIPSSLFEEIASMEARGSYGSKIQTLVAHLLYLQIVEPGAKSIVFSAFADSLHIVEHALRLNGVPCLRIDSTKGKQHATKRFRTDPEILVLLLHGERENAGLNVTCASRVFLLESVVHHSFEIQAIARIDRMGQSRPTEVFCYYAEDTVEKNILDLAARQGLSLYTTESAKGTLDVAPLAPDSDKNLVDAPTKKKLQKGDFIFKLDDMMSILFPHLVEDVEYLLPPSEAGEDEDALMRDVDDPQPGPSRIHAPAYVNAVAGPSRLG